jgi:hypothetical protein
MKPDQLLTYLLFFAAAIGVVVGWWTFFASRTFWAGFLNLGACFLVSGLLVGIAFRLS